MVQQEGVGDKRCESYLGCDVVFVYQRELGWIMIILNQLGKMMVLDVKRKNQKMQVEVVILEGMIKVIIYSQKKKQSFWLSVMRFWFLESWK